jgi:hypothetical protein
VFSVGSAPKLYKEDSRPAEIELRDVEFELFTAVTMKNSLFWDMVPCRSCENRRFGGTYSLHLQGRKICERGTSVSRWLRLSHQSKTPSYINSGTVQSQNYWHRCKINYGQIKM